MSDLNSLLTSPGFFFAGSNKNVPQDLRQRLALALMAQKRKSPSTFGEGLTAIGDSLGDIGMMRRLESEAAASEQVGQAAYDKLVNGGGGAPTPPGGPPPGQPPMAAGPPPPQGQTPPPAPPPPPARPMVLGSATPDEPVRLNPDGSIAGNLSSPQVLPPPGAPQQPGGVPPVPPPGPPPGQPTVANFNQKPILAPTPPLAPPGTPPIMAQGGALPPTAENPASLTPEAAQQRRAIALSMLQQGQTGQPPASAFTGPQPAAAASPPAAAPPQPPTPPPPAPSIAQAPSAAPIQKMPPPAPAAPQPAQEGPQPGYVLPLPKPPTPPSTMTKPMQDIANIINNTPPADRKTVAERLKPLYDAETAKVAQAHEIWKDQMTQHRALELEHYKQQAGAAKDVADVGHIRSQTRKESIVENPEEKYIMGPDNVVRPIRVEGENPNAMPSGKLTEDQRKTLVYHGWAKSGNQAITGNDQLLAHGLAQEAIGKIPGFGNAAQDDAYRRAKNGADNFILSFMRSTSGAQYGPTERLDHAKAMLPRQGDDARTLADKAAARQQFIDSEYAGLGKQGQKMADYLAKSYDPGSSENKQRLIDIEMQGVKGAEIGEIKTNKNPKSPYFGQQRIWNGSRWVEH